MWLFPPSGNVGILLGSVGNSGGSEVNFESPDDELCPGSSSNSRGSAKISQSELYSDGEGGARILLGSVWNAKGSDVNFKPPDNALCPGSSSNAGGSVEQEIRLPLKAESIGHGRSGHSKGAHHYSVK